MKTRFSMRVRLAIGMWLYRKFILPAQLTNIRIPYPTHADEDGEQIAAADDYVLRKYNYPKPRSDKG